MSQQLIQLLHLLLVAAERVGEDGVPPLELRSGGRSFRGALGTSRAPKNVGNSEVLATMTGTIFAVGFGRVGVELADALALGTSRPPEDVRNGEMLSAATISRILRLLAALPIVSGVDAGTRVRI